MTMLAHCVKTLDDGDAKEVSDTSKESTDAPQASMVAHTVGNPNPPAEEYKADAFENMNKNVAVHNVIEAPTKPKTYKIVMIRHGESEWNKENRFCGW